MNKPPRPSAKKSAQGKFSSKKSFEKPGSPSDGASQGANTPKRFEQNSLRLVAEARNLKLKKSYSQNFLVDETILARMVEKMDLKPGDEVLEIGPGAGFLTEKILETGAHVTAVELDPDMIRVLTKKWSTHPRFSLVHQDILKFDLAEYLASRPEGKSVKVVGNLPYNITSSILFFLLGELEDAQVSWRGKIPWIGLMVQKEVGERIAARPGSKAYNPLSIAVQYWYDAKLELSMPSRAFYPPPKVDSVMVGISPRTEPVFAVANIKRFDQLIRSAFSQRRKTLKNSLVGTSFCTAEGLTEALEKLSDTPEAIDASHRAEALSIPQLGALCNAFYPNPG